jgi:hypothetical protein
LAVASSFTGPSRSLMAHMVDGRGVGLQVAGRGIRISSP